MAKSKNGGTRSFIKGRIGSDVYSVGKDGKGSRQQVVRSLAEQVSNPRTQSQMFGRMVMSTVMQAVAGMSMIIDHSFDGLPKGQPNISEFIRRNYALVKADAIAHPSSGNKFALNEYQEKGIQKGEWVIAAGSAQVPAAVGQSGVGMYITLTADTLTVGGLKAALGLSAEGYLTAVAIEAGKGLEYFRAHLSTTLADSTAITGSNVASLFEISGNVTPTVSLDDNTIEIEVTQTDVDAIFALIVSDKIDGAWVHNNAKFTNVMNLDSPADTVLPTYPTGGEAFLNGGAL